MAEPVHPVRHDNDDPRTEAGSLRVQILGSLRLWRGGVELNAGPRQQAHVLALLVARVGQPVSTGDLIDLIWAEDAPASALNVIHKYIGALRRLLEPAVPARSSGRYLHRHGNAYVFTAGPDVLDLVSFRELVDAARAALARQARDLALDCYVEALGLWKGHAGAGFADGSAAPVLAALDDEFHTVCAAATELAVSLRQPERVILPLQLAASMALFHEPVQASLITALGAAGRQAEALSAFQAVRDRLAEELGIDPSAPLQAAHRRVLTQTPTTPSIAGTGRGGDPTPAGQAGVVGPGEETREESDVLLQASGPDLMEPVVPSVVAARVRPAGVPRQLPTDVSRFVGRALPLKQLDGLLSDVTGASAAVATIVGTAGVGKTSLAVHWSHSAAERFPDGQLYANLRGFDPTGAVARPDEVLRGFLTALGAPAQSLSATTEGLVSQYRSELAGRRVLIVLDNARDASQVRPLLPSASGSFVLVTSRDQLTGLVALDGAEPIAIDVLDPDEAYDLLTRRLGPARLSAEPDAATEIITRCARLPLALAVTAARAAVRPELPLAGLVEEMREAQTPLDALGGTDAASDVRSVFGCSYAALREPTATLFRRLGLHPGPDLTVPAAASACGLPVAQVRPLLAELAGANLISEHRPGRFAFHDLLRAYAADLAERLDTADDRHCATRRLIDHHVHSADTANRQFGKAKHSPVEPPPAGPGVSVVEPADEQRALAWFDAEVANLIAVARQVEAAELDRHTIAYAAILENYLRRRGLTRLWVSLQETAVRAAGRLGDPAALRAAFSCLGGALNQMGDHDGAIQLYQRAIDLGPDPDPVRQGGIHLGLAAVFTSLGRYAAASDEINRALALFRGGNDRDREAAALNDIGWNHYLAGDYDQALVSCTQALALFEVVGNRSGQAYTWDSLGQAHHKLGHEDEASACHQRSLAMLRELGHRYAEAIILLHIGDCHEAGGRGTDARLAWQEALAILDALDHPDAEDARARLTR
ncbi:AfsR/SARP family transcriptional regulator [Micromonospora sp. NPDC004704]